ncbi:hypothetical protein KFU94_55185 [Chloroflexi bacterium TSY]|nr:hypothetical protein [Chloroflexi bacterium TSY]
MDGNAGKFPINVNRLIALAQGLIRIPSLPWEETEVVDPRTLAPLDTETILKSVAKTGSLAVVDEAREPCSAASEISACVAQYGFSPPLEQAVVPGPERIVQTIQKIMDY